MARRRSCRACERPGPERAPRTNSAAVADGARAAATRVGVGRRSRVPVALLPGLGDASRSGSSDPPPVVVTRACPSPLAWRVPPDRLAVHRQRLPRSPAVLWPLVTGLQPPGKPGACRGINRTSVHRLQDPADGGLIRRLEPAGQRSTPDPDRGQDLRWGVSDPSADRGQRLRTGEYRRRQCQ